METPPLVVNIVKQFTGAEPMQGMMADVEAVIAWPGMLSASGVMGYPYADVPEMGMSFVAVHDGDPAAAREAARWLARRAWERRAEFVGDTPSPDEALRHAMAAPQGPVVLMDVGDNIGGGSAADSTVLLAAAQRLGVRGYLQTLYDPEAVAACIAAGVGATVTLAVGGKTDDLHGQPVTVTGRVRLICGRQVRGPAPDARRLALLRWRHDRRARNDRRPHARADQRAHRQHQHRADVLGRHLAGEEAGRRRQGRQSPSPAYAPIAAEIILVNTPGVTSSDLSTFTYRHRRRPLYPFEPRRDVRRIIFIRDDTCAQVSP